ncbi:MAG: hypothetical protein ERJ67_05680 [Aphanocapsa feldmannii 277cV]|uniref:Nuclease SbcCD subunit C n=1 Tax=Aphanocapsa feldmannii 277cV TaxID=2507553 RepID=A0A524RNG4_9CHRO|nr:MAG: hypothetical protein ERJ67_05680 [Aphanocapsa feldmannii 277cV]
MAINSIIKWASKQPKWQQDALRRLAFSLELADKDISMILANLKQEIGLQTKDQLVCQPLKKSDLQSDTREVPLAYLCSIDNVRNVNCLAPNQKLDFALNGITLIYGYNGSGKSGYCRILKKFSRAISKDTIYPDVFAGTNSSPAEARIRYKLEKEINVSETTWRDRDGDGSSDVAHLSVFDSYNARLYMDKKNQIDYLPYEIDLLTRFAQLLSKLQKRLEIEIKEVNQHLSINVLTDYTSETEVFKLVSRLTPKKMSSEQLPTIDEINSLGIWTDENMQDLNMLQTTIGSDPRTVTDRYSRAQAVISSLIKELKQVWDALSQDKVKELEMAVERARTTAKTASLAATTLFRDEPLADVGSDPWRRMFEHAIEYSKLAYPGIEFPAKRKNDLCVLCQQPLTDKAAERLHRFKDYIAGKVRNDAHNNAVIRDAKVTAIKSLQIHSAEHIKSLLGEYAGLSDTRAETAASVEIFVREAHNYREKLLAAVQSGDFLDIVEPDNSIIDKLDAEKTELTKEVANFGSVAGDDTDLEKRKKRLDSLQDQKRLSENLETIRTRRNNLELKDQLEQCVKAVKTNSVSRKVSALQKELVIDDLKKRIDEEIHVLDLADIPVLINDNSRRGESMYEVKLDAQRKILSREILSEGEQQALSLACFLADVKGQPAKHGIILDDPVSSLDHIRIRRVATRLVDEAATGRQIIIFTHNLVFFSEVRSLAAAKTPNPVPVLTNIILKETKHHFGIVKNDDQPWEGKKTKQRIVFLQEKINKLDESSDTYREEVKGFYTELRETWERLVEEVLLSKVVERYGADVKTQSLKSVLVENEDYGIIFWAMKHVSERCGHDMAAAKNMPLPKIEDLKKDILKLDEYLDKLRKRSKITKGVREKLEQPPKAETI